MTAVSAEAAAAKKTTHSTLEAGSTSLVSLFENQKGISP
jgi:hypothetical protein